MHDELKLFPENKEDFLRFLKSKSQLFHLSNVFFRDFQYGIIAYAEEKGKQVTYGSAEKLAKKVVADLEQSGILKAVKPGSWMLNYPEFRKPSSKPEPVARPTSAAVDSKPSPGSVNVAPPSGTASPANA